jgi:RTX calcium-binding nonapeptide repeat (4 copies)
MSVTPGPGAQTIRPYISGDAGSDEDLVGGRDVVHGGAGRDVFLDGASQFNDVYRGGSGSDLVLFSEGGGPIFADLNTGEATGQGHDLLFSIEDLISGPGADTLIGNDVANECASTARPS